MAILKTYETPDISTLALPFMAIPACVHLSIAAQALDL
jgi:hypothetical protein